MKIGLVVLLGVAVSMPALAHRLDEYLQTAIVTIERDRIQAELTLVPGVAVLPGLLAEIGSESDGSISEAKRRAYVLRVLRDLSLTVDGQPLTLKQGAVHFPSAQEMHDGLGEIRIALSAGLPAGGRNRKLVFENRHQSRIAAYQVNCLVPRDQRIRIVAQHRNYSQSRYELEYTQGT